MRAIAMICTAATLLLSPAAGLAQGIEAISKPSKDVTLSFVRPGRIAEVLVKEGDTVKPGQVLARQDNEPELTQLEKLRAQAEYLIPIKAAEAKLAQTRIDLQNLELALSKGAAGVFEVDHAKLDVLMAELTVDKYKFENEQDRRSYLEAKLQIDRTRLESPIAGIVEQIFLQAGEGADALARVFRVVSIDPLWIEAPVPLAEARSLCRGQVALVDFPEAAGPAEGKVIHLAAVSEAASDTLMVRVEIPNPRRRHAGEHVVVRFPLIAAEGRATTRPADVPNIGPSQ